MAINQAFWDILAAASPEDLALLREDIRRYSGVDLAEGADDGAEE